MSELLDVQVNVQKESLKDTSGVHASSCKPTKSCAMKMKQRNKQRKKKQCACKNVINGEGHVWKTCAMDIKLTSFKLMIVDTMKVLFV